jgi:membrane-associated phospholipid phosphatase
MGQALDRNVSPTDTSPRGDSGHRGIHNVPVYARLAIPVLALFALVYFGTNWISSRRTGNHQLFFDWELAIPFVPGMIYVYASLLVLLLLPAFTLTKHQIRALARAMVITLFSAAVIFLLLPTDLGFERPVYVAGYGAVYQALYAIELPHNLVPSLHIACSTLLIAAIHNNTSSPWVRFGLVLWCTLLCVSVLLVHQHHVLDVISGLLLGLITYRLVYLRYQSARQLARSN